MSDLKQRFLRILATGATFPLRDCSICGYTCAWGLLDGSLVYDPGCDCTVGGSNWEPRSAEQLDFYFHPDRGWIDTITAFVERHE